MELIKLTGIGFILGITAIIPGFSVATMAVVFSVYDRLINVIVPDLKKIFEAWMFWLPLVIGGIAGIFFFSKVFSLLMENHSTPAYWFFIGVITGSIPLIYSKVCPQAYVCAKTNINSETSQDKKDALPSLPSVICFVIAIAVMIVFAFVKPEEGTVVYTELTLHVFGMLAAAGALAAIAMIIPGISGAFMLLVIGFYRTVLLAVSELNVPLIIPVVLGALAGLLLSAAFVRFLLAKVPRETYGAVLGLVVGSIFVLYREAEGIGEGIGIVISAVCFIVGLVLSFLMSRRNIVK
ncbi:MAG: DUF368 domain-containing protein [Treponema sp.]|nr:DUF368 domain-containing protein [Treponema sp.]